MRERRREQGFTIIELMVTVVVIAILAAITIPMFTKESRKSKAGSEVGAIFSELGVREEQYKTENGAYISTTACPPSTSPTGTTVASLQSSGCLMATSTWIASLRVKLDLQTLICSYVVTASSGSGTTNPSGFTWTSPVNQWFYIIATCDTDGVTTTNSTYFTSSSDATIQKQNEGK
jgi:prepilin-type N-terminal cleavage/methylation domain-containing protein